MDRSRIDIYSVLLRIPPLALGFKALNYLTLPRAVRRPFQPVIDRCQCNVRLNPIGIAPFQVFENIFCLLQAALEFVKLRHLQTGKRPIGA
jgi:hypothetical protein